MHTVTTKIGGFISSMISNRSVGICGNGNQRQFIFVIEKNRWIDVYFHSKTNFIIFHEKNVTTVSYECVIASLPVMQQKWPLDHLEETNFSVFRKSTFLTS